MASNRAGLYVSYCRFAAFVFLLVALYTMAVKAPSGELASDWLHTLFHLLTAGVAMYLGWFRPRGGGPRLFTLAVVAVYGSLGVIGWLIDGIAMDTPFRIPLQAADNGFHLVLAATGLVASLRSEV